MTSFEPRRRILLVTGARPNFMKVAPLITAIGAYPDLDPVFIHTGQHYDDGMSRVFLEDLSMPTPHVCLGVGSGTHAEQTAKVMLAFEPELERHHPDIVVVVGDVNSTVACALTAVKLGIPVAHVEAGVRSFDRTMPEEINRIVTDAVADLLFAPSESGQQNLLREGKPPDRIFLLGDVMIDTMLRHRSAAEARPIRQQLGLHGRCYGLLTLHRASNVDDGHVLAAILDAVAEVQREVPIVFPVHPRTARRLEEFGLASRLRMMSDVIALPPVGYLDFLALLAHASLVLTDSGGVQTEATAVGVPCLTLRDTTEWPETIETGTNSVVGTDPQHIVAVSRDVLTGNYKRGSCPPLWDGKAADRIIRVVHDYLSGDRSR